MSSDVNNFFSLRNCYNGMNIIITPNEIIFKTRQGETRKNINITIDDIRSQLSQMGYKAPYSNYNYYVYYSQALEDSERLPYINYIYYYLFFLNMKIPSLTEVVDKYIETYCNIYPNGMIDLKPFFGNMGFCFTKEQLTGRIFRAYNSFHRELELLFQLRSYEGIYIEYNFQTDLAGIDFTVIYNNKVVCLASYAHTKRAIDWKMVKNNSRHDYSNYNMLDLIAVVDSKSPNYNCVSYNGIYLYSPTFVANTYIDIVNLTK